MLLQGRLYFLWIFTAERSEINSLFSVKNSNHIPNANDKHRLYRASCNYIASVFIVILHRFHLTASYQKNWNIASTNMSAEEKEFSCLYVKQLLNAQTNELFDAAVQLIKDELPCFFSYIEVNWLPYKDSISSVGRKSLRHLSNRTNNRIESFHDTLHSVIVVLVSKINTILSL